MRDILEYWEIVGKACVWNLYYFGRLEFLLIIDEEINILCEFNNLVRKFIFLLIISNVYLFYCLQISSYTHSNNQNEYFNLI